MFSWHKQYLAEDWEAVAYDGWKAGSHVTHNRYYPRHYPTQKHFANAILNFMLEVIPKQWLSFRDQVTDNFRIILYQNVRVLE